VGEGGRIWWRQSHRTAAAIRFAAEMEQTKNQHKYLADKQVTTTKTLSGQHQPQIRAASASEKGFHQIYIYIYIYI